MSFIASKPSCDIKFMFFQKSFIFRVMLLVKQTSRVNLLCFCVKFHGTLPDFCFKLHISFYPEIVCLLKMLIKSDSGTGKGKPEEDLYIIRAKYKHLK